jgi:hypothetical protein
MKFRKNPPNGHRPSQKKKRKKKKGPSAIVSPSETIIPFSLSGRARALRSDASHGFHHPPLARSDRHLLPHPGVHILLLTAAPWPLISRRSAPRPLALRARPPRRVTVVCSSAAADAETSDSAPAEKFRLDNLGPQKGSRRRRKRKGRGISAGQGASCGFGMRGQKSRSGPGVRRGFEGGQMPLYRRIPKLRGIAGGELLQSEISSCLLNRSIIPALVNACLTSTLPKLHSILGI